MRTAKRGGGNTPSPASGHSTNAIAPSKYGSRSPHSAGETPSSGVMAYHRSCGIRNCLLDCEFTDDPVRIAGITFSGATATVTTKWPHNRFPGQWVVITGALENGAPSTVYNGAFPISAVLSATQFQCALFATPSAEPTGEMYIGKYPSNAVGITSLLIDTSSGPPYTVTVSTFKPHYRRMGENVVTTGVLVAGSLNNLFNNDSHLITHINSPTQLEFQIDANPGPPSHAGAAVGEFSWGLSADGGTGAFAEGNRIYNCLVGGPYHDFWSSKDLVACNNYFYNVNNGPRQSMGAVNSAPKAGAS